MVILSQLLELMGRWKEKQSSHDFCLFHTNAYIITVVPSHMTHSCCLRGTLNTVRWYCALESSLASFLLFLPPFCHANSNTCCYISVLCDFQSHLLHISQTCTFNERISGLSMEVSAAHLSCPIISYIFLKHKWEKSAQINIATSRQQAAKVSEQTGLARIGTSAMQTLRKWFGNRKKAICISLCFTFDKTATKRGKCFGRTKPHLRCNT